MESTSNILTTIFTKFLVLERDLIYFVPDQYYDYLKYLPVLLVFFLLAFLLTPLIGYLATKYDVMDKPAEERSTGWNKFDNPSRHIHKTKVPYFGGLSILIPMIIFIPVVFTLAGDLIFIYIGIILLTLSGFLDDKYNLPSTVQFGFQFLAALLLAFSTKDIDIVKIPFDGTISLDWLHLNFDIFSLQASLSLPGDLLLIVWTIFFINAVKWVAGVDALMEGNLIIAFALIYILGIRTGDPVSTIISLMMVGGLLGFIIYNYPPAKIFSGSTGKTTFGYLAAALSLFNGTKSATSYAILLLPVIDALFVIGKRYFQHKPKNLLDLLRMNGTDHLHHRLLEMNLPVKLIVLLEMSVTLLVGSLAILSTEAYRFFVVAFSVFIVTLLVTLVHLFSVKKKDKPGRKEKEETPESKYSY